MAAQCGREGGKWIGQGLALRGTKNRRISGITCVQPLKWQSISTKVSSSRPWDRVANFKQKQIKST
jgi:hypothetical protein